VSDTQRLVTINVANLYASPSDTAELASQALLGAKVSVSKEQDGFCLVHTEDLYQGWVNAQHLAHTWNDEDYFPTSIATLFADIYARPDAHSELLTKLSVGTRVLLGRGGQAHRLRPQSLPQHDPRRQH